MSISSYRREHPSVLACDTRGKRSSLVLLGVGFLLLIGCTSLKPIDLSEEKAIPKATTAAWPFLEDEPLSGDWQVLLDDGPEALDWRLRAIDSATVSIDLQTFLWSLDTAGTQMFDHLLAAADRGVRVRLLVDDTFLNGEDGLLLFLDQHPHIEYRIFNPFKRRANGQVTRQILNLAEFHRLDHRMHNKVMVVDGRIAIIGGRNLADEYFGLHEHANFRDLELLLGGSSVDQISTSFDAYWNDDWAFPVNSVSARPPSDILLRNARLRARKLQIHDEQDPQTRERSWRELAARAAHGISELLIDDPPRGNPAERASAPVQVAEALIDLIDSAQEEILLVSAYLIPTLELEDAIERAIDRGVRIRILTNSVSSNNHLSAHSAYRRHIGQLMDHGAELYEVRADAHERARYMLQPITGKILALHAKALVIDRDQVFIGSPNLDPRSLRINTEIGLLIRSSTFNTELRAALAPDFSDLNAWSLQFDHQGNVVWVSGDTRLMAEPANSTLQRIEDWFIALLPVEGEL